VTEKERQLKSILTLYNSDVTIGRLLETEKALRIVNVPVVVAWWSQSGAVNPQSTPESSDHPPVGRMMFTVVRPLSTGNSCSTEHFYANVNGIIARSF